MDLTELLQQTDARLELGNRWLGFDPTESEWFVYEHQYAQRGSTCLYQGSDLLASIEALTKED